MPHSVYTCTCIQCTVYNELILCSKIHVHVHVYFFKIIIGVHYPYAVHVLMYILFYYRVNLRFLKQKWRKSIPTRRHWNVIFSILLNCSSFCYRHKVSFRRSVCTLYIHVHLHVHVYMCLLTCTMYMYLSSHLPTSHFFMYP